MADLYLNSKYQGTVETPQQFLEDFKDLRRKGSLPEDVNIYYDNEANDLHILTDEGRARRPLIIVKDGKALLTDKHLEQLKNGEITWVDLVRQGVVEYLDAAEEENALVAYQEEDLTGSH